MIELKENIDYIINNKIFFFPKNNKFYNQLDHISDFTNNCNYFKSTGRFDINKYMSSNYSAERLYCVLKGKYRFDNKIYYNYKQFELTNSKSNNSKQGEIPVSHVLLKRLSEKLGLCFIWLDKSTDEILVFYKENMPLAISSLFVETYKKNNKFLFTIIEKKYLILYLKGSSKNTIKNEFQLYFMYNMPTILKKRYMIFKKDLNHKEFSYKQDYNDRFTFISKPRSQKFIKTYMKQIHRKTINKYNKYICSPLYQRFYNNTKLKVNRYKFKSNMVKCKNINKYFM